VAVLSGGRLHPPGRACPGCRNQRPVAGASRIGRKGPGSGSTARNIFLPYFALLGLAYMLVEVALIQKLILPLEDPPVAVAAVLASLLISSGIGSLFSHRYPA